jgi:hypothetical protein
MQTIQFESKSYNGIIGIPKDHRDWYDRTLKVILLKKNGQVVRDTDKAEIMRFVDRFNADLTGYKFDRDEANER